MSESQVNHRKLVNTGVFKVPDKRFSHVMVDIVGPLPDSYGYKYLLTAVDRTTRFVQAAPMTEASSQAAATAFLNSWVAFFGVPTVVTSDNGGSFTANLWKDMMSRLNIEVKYSALYHPQSVGLIERQHRSIKESLKASIEEMVGKHQNKSFEFLPFVLLGRRTAVQPDIGASSCELAMGTTVRVPGQLLQDPGSPLPEDDVRSLLHSIRQKTNMPASPTSSHGQAKIKLQKVPEGATHVYTKQHKTQGLQPSYEGPFEIDSWLSKSTVKINVGLFSNGEKRQEVRHINDLKFAHPDSLVAPAHRPKLGRPTGPSSSSGGQPSTEVTTETTPSNQFLPERQLPQPPASSFQTSSKQAAGNFTTADATQNLKNHETSNRQEPALPSSANDEFKGVITGPPPAQAFKRPYRSTRNPNPTYIDSFWLASAIGQFGADRVYG